MIKALYEAKLEIKEKEQGKDLPQDVRKAYITDDPFGSYLRLRRSKKYDPRYPHVQFKDRKTAEKGVKIADKLDSLSDKEFLYSGYPYIWQDEIGLGNLVLDSAI